MKKVLLYSIGTALLAVVLYQLWVYFTVVCLCNKPTRLDGKVVLISDGPSLLGREIAGEFARRGASVTMACSKAPICQDIVHTLLEAYGEKGSRLKLDVASNEMENHLTPIKESQLKIIETQLNSMKTIREFAAHLTETTSRLDFLVNNAAILTGSYGVTADGIESFMGINHLAHYVLTEALLPLLQRSRTGSKIFNIASAEHYYGTFRNGDFLHPPANFMSMHAYSRTKLANVIHAKLLARQLEGSKIVPISINPGYILPSLPMLWDGMFGNLFKTRWQASQTVISAALSDDLVPGGYYSDCYLTQPNSEAMNETVIKFVQRESQRLTGLF